MKIKNIYLMFMLMSSLSLMSCGSGLTDMFDDMNAKVPVCVDGSVTQAVTVEAGEMRLKPYRMLLTHQQLRMVHEIWVKQGTYTLTATLTVNKPVHIRRIYRERVDKVGEGSGQQN